MTIARVYSDVSRRHLQIGYCAIVVIEQPYQTYTYAGHLPGSDNNVAAEIEALAIGLEMCGIAERVIALTDQDWLPSYMAGRLAVSYAIKKDNAIAINRLRLAAARHSSIEFRSVSRSDSVYKKCHKLSRREAADAARRLGTIGPIESKAKKKRPERERLADALWRGKQT